MYGWSHLYSTRKWAKRSRFQRRLQPLCECCKAAGRVKEAHLAHHVHEYRPGNTDLDFWFGPLESLCRDCHEIKHGRALSPRQFEPDIGVDGLPLDPSHPFWRHSK
jgi:hypothetical protein